MPWSLSASTAPMVAATIQAFLVAFIFWDLVEMGKREAERDECVSALCWWIGEEEGVGGSLYSWKGSEKTIGTG